MAIPLNPYVAGNPVGDSPAFVGRADVLREVLHVLRRPQDNAIVLYGQRRIGKTSILQHLAGWPPYEGSYHPVYFDLQDKADWPLDRVLRDLARTIAHTLNQPDPNLRPDPENAFCQEWLPAVLDDLPEGCSLVLLFDEFDVLADPKAGQAAAAFFPYLRGLLASAPQRLQFVFVIGRNVDDLTNIALSLFKGTPYQRVSLLDQEDTADLVSLSEANGTLHWPDEAVERVWQLTNGHPFLTQQLCSHVWGRAYDEEPDEPPTVSPADVDTIVPDVLETSRNSFEWLWDGLPPAERVVASALAEAGPGPITEDELEHLLREGGVRVVIRELQNAPQLLQDWDLIEPADSAYRFRVELLRRWITEQKPLRRVQEELDHIEPAAENLYQAALGLYQDGKLDQAIEPLRQAVSLNPNHVRANELLADILLARGQTGEARQLLERLYQYQPAAARPSLVQALLAQAQTADGGDEKLACYEQVLRLDPTQPEALDERQRILGARARISSLFPWNPLDYLRLLWWVLVTPQQIRIYHQAFGKKYERRVGNWLVSTLTWLPLFILTLALRVGTLPHSRYAPSSTDDWWIGLGLVTAWMLTGWLGETDNDFVVFVAGGVGFALSVGVVFDVVNAGVVVSAASVLVGTLAALLAFGVVVVVALNAAGDVASSAAVGVTAAVALSILAGVGLGTMSIASGMLNSYTGGSTVDWTKASLGQWAASVVVLFLGFMAILSVVLMAANRMTLVANSVKEGLGSGHPSWIARGGFGVLVLAHTFIIWFSFLGGWHVFQ